jgi:integrase
LKIGAARLTNYFGRARELRTISPGDCDEWVLWLKERYAEATVGKSLKWGKQFFRAAFRKKLVPENPFEDVKGPGETNEARKRFIDRNTADQVFDACPSPEWRLIFALSRFGGLRCPSEHMTLEWADVNWEKSEFLVRSPKTGNRRVPLFPELRPYFEEAFELASEGGTHVICRYRNPAKDLRSQLLRILRRAGVSPWPRLFHNLRASRETELAAEYPLHVVCSWIGNTERIAAKHYLQVTDDYFQRAAGGAARSGAVSPEKALQNPVQQPAAPARTGSQTGNYSLAGCDLVREGASWSNALPDVQLTPTGFEPVSRP